jgi:uncharacterized protein YhhL (DUF1145 family)
MSTGKIGCLVLYAVLAVVALTQAGTTAATAAVWILGILAVVHAAEVVMLYPLCKQAGGSLAGNLFQVFVFGYYHMIEMKAAAGKQ